MKPSANIKSSSDTKQDVEYMAKKFSSSRTKTKYKTPKLQQQEKKNILTNPTEKNNSKIPKNADNCIGDFARNEKNIKKIKKNSSPHSNTQEKQQICGSIRKIIINKTTTKSIRQIRSRKILKKLDSTIQPSAFVHVLSAFINENLENLEYDYFASTRKISMTLHDVPEESDDIYENSFLTYNVLKNNNKCTSYPILNKFSKTVQTNSPKSSKNINTSFVKIMEHAENTSETLQKILDMSDEAQKLVIKFEDQFEDKDKELLQMLFDNRYSKNESEIVLELLELKNIYSKSDDERSDIKSDENSEVQIEEPQVEKSFYDKSQVVTLFFRNFPKKDQDSLETIKTTTNTKELDDFEKDVFDFLTNSMEKPKIVENTSINEDTNVESLFDDDDFLTVPSSKLVAPHFSKILSKFGVTVRERINRFLAEQNFKFCKIALSEHNVEKEVLFLYTR